MQISLAATHRLLDFLKLVNEETTERVDDTIDALEVLIWETEVISDFVKETPFIDIPPHISNHIAVLVEDYKDSL